MFSCVSQGSVTRSLTLCLVVCPQDRLSNPRHHWEEEQWARPCPGAPHHCREYSLRAISSQTHRVPQKNKRKLHYLILILVNINICKMDSLTSLNCICKVSIRTFSNQRTKRTNKHQIVHIYITSLWVLTVHLKLYIFYIYFHIFMNCVSIFKNIFQSLYNIFGRKKDDINRRVDNIFNHM